MYHYFRIYRITIPLRPAAAEAKRGPHVQQWPERGAEIFILAFRAGFGSKAYVNENV